MTKTNPAFYLLAKCHKMKLNDAFDSDYYTSWRFRNGWLLNRIDNQIFSMVYWDCKLGGF